MNNTFMNNFPLKVIELFGGHPGTYKLFYTDWIVIRHLEELALGRPTTLSEDEFQKLGNAREFFREKYKQGITMQTIDFDISKVLLPSIEATSMRYKDVQAYKTKFENGETPPPIFVFYRRDQEDNQREYFIQDGHRRVAAAQELGIKTLPAVVWDFT